VTHNKTTWLELVLTAKGVYWIKIVRDFKRIFYHQ